MHADPGIRDLLRSALDFVRSMLAWPSAMPDPSRRDRGATRRRSTFDPFMSQDSETAPADGTLADASASGSPDGLDTPASSASGASAAVSDELQRELDEQKDRYLRLAAEFQNYRQRSAREQRDAGARAQADLVRHLIDALDDLGRFAHVDPAGTDAATVVQGVEMVEKKLAKALGAAGLEVVDPTGQAFDPALHEAVATEPAGSAAEDHQVARVYQVGYLFGGQLLRPARVVVRQHG